MRAWLACLVVLAACGRDLAISDDVCGNGVLDPGEDCDQPGVACTAACRIACAPDAAATCSAAGAIDGTCCPGGMTCGRDAVCHAPTGTVSASPLVEPLNYTAVRIGDLDGDHLDDLVGVGIGTVEVRYGDATAPLSRAVPVLAPPITPGADNGFGDLDGDGRPDLALPTRGGLFAFDETTGSPTPVAFPVDITTGRVHWRIAHGTVLFGLFGGVLEYDQLAAHDPGTTNFQLTLLQSPSPTQQGYTPYDTQPSLCGITADLSPAAAVRGRALHPFIDGVTVRVPLVLGTALAAICVATANPGQGGAAGYMIPKTVFGAHSPAVGDGETFFANLFSSGCPDLVVPARAGDGSEASMILKGLGSSGACQVDEAAADATFVTGLPLAAIALGPLGLDPARPGLVTSAGVYSFPAIGQPRLVTQAPRPWRFAQAGDLDGDGHQDFVAAGATGDLDIMRYVSASGWSDLVIPTEQAVDHLVLGNFDGDKSGDVAFTAPDPDSTTGAEALSVAWGSLDGTFVTTNQGSFPELHDLVTVQFQDPALPSGLDQNDDLVLARGGASGADPSDPALLIDEYGSTARLFTAPYVYTSTFADPGTSMPIFASQGIVAQIGRFGTNDTEEMLALFAPLTTSSGTGNPTYNTALLALAPASYGGVTKVGEALSNTCEIPSSTDVPFCPTSAHWLSVDHAGGDVLLGLRSDTDGGALSQCAAYYVGGTSPLALSMLSCAALAPAAAAATDADTQAAYAALTGVDLTHLLDSDGTIAHVAIGRTQVHAEQTFVWTLSLASGQPQLASPVALDSELEHAGVLPPGATAACMDATELELGTREVGGVVYGDGHGELVIACSIITGTTYDTQLWARYRDPGGGAPHYALLVDLGADLDVRLRSGDVDGDGLADVLYSAGSVERGDRQVHVLLQCDAHRTGCVGGP